MPLDGLAGYDAWKTTDPRDVEPEDDLSEQEKATDWLYLETEAKKFAEKYGVADLVLCLSRALR